MTIHRRRSLRGRRWAYRLIGDDGLSLCSRGHLTAGPRVEQGQPGQLHVFIMAPGERQSRTADPPTSMFYCVNPYAMLVAYVTPPLGVRAQVGIAVFPFLFLFPPRVQNGRVGFWENGTYLLAPPTCKRSANSQMTEVTALVGREGCSCSALRPRWGHSRRFWHVRGTSACPPLATDERTS
jgi:hypothetical protein